ncbi:MAG: hypothetical protein IJE49_02710 [Agathobacter sp.]|nr:hypothetical protein [Agathobacter sp.]
MAKEEVKIGQLPRDLNAIRDTMRDICLRGYRERKYFERIGIGLSNYDNQRNQIEYLLNETEALNELRFINQPMEWQDNPLAQLFCQTIPNVQDFFYSYALLNYLSCIEDDKATIGYIKDKLDEECQQEKEFECQQIKRKLENLEKQLQITGNGRGDSKSWTLNPPIWELDDENRFSYNELIKLYDYVCFLAGTMPFELPFYLLKKNIELWMEREYKAEFEKHEKEMFLFQHRNQTNVLDSEIIYALLMWKKKSQKDVMIFYNTNSYEYGELLHEGRQIKIEQKGKRGEKTGYRPLLLNLEKLEYDCHTGILKALNKIGEMDEFDVLLPRNIMLYTSSEKKVDKNQILLNWKKEEPSELKMAFHTLNNVYFERLIKLTFNYMKDTWTKEELINNLFKGDEYWYTEIFDRVIRCKAECEKKPRKTKDLQKEEKAKREKKVSVALFEENGDKYSWKIKPDYKLFYTPRLALEALKSIPEIHQFTSLFLEDDIVEKIKKCTEGFESTWNINDIVLVNSKEGNLSREEKNVFVKTLIKKFRAKQFIFDKQSKKYYPLRLQYSIYKDEFRVLARKVGSDELKMLSQENLDISRAALENTNLVKSSRTYKNELDKYMRKMHFKLKMCLKVEGVLDVNWKCLYDAMEKLEKSLEEIEETEDNREQISKLKEALKKKEEIKSIEMKYKKETLTEDMPFDVAELDNILSDGWMNLLAAYKHETHYTFAKPGEKSGEFDVTLWYWYEDENEIIEEFKSFNSAFKMVDLETNIL